ncbi:Photosystem I P700 chlorophyll a apoprotein A2 [bioreactor metagenome]|uniref:Photosystem I P700 chlorophyll a apoprotein A2 n=1 Tax=bioreactor metagenome TaxID=1076179 RepID=A0A645FAP0_9ZZZZ
MHLSLERAKSVRNELIKLGVENNRLKVKGYGKTKPIVPNDTEENRKKNRRTEFIVIE